jgi:hypothetical protein
MTWRHWVGGLVLAAVLLGAAGCWQAVPATKTPTSKDSGDREELPPPKRDPG